MRHDDNQKFPFREFDASTPPTNPFLTEPLLTEPLPTKEFVRNFFGMIDQRLAANEKRQSQVDRADEANRAYLDEITRHLTETRMSPARQELVLSAANSLSSYCGNPRSGTPGGTFAPWDMPDGDYDYDPRG